MLAALLAVKRGFVSPEQAMELLAAADAAEADQAADAAADTEHESAPGANASAMQTILDASPDRQFESDLDRAMQDPGQALAELGVPSTVREGLLHEPPRELLHQTLLSVAAGAPLPQPEPQLNLPPSKRYDIRSEHARGGMGRILIAIDNSIGREVALKELLPVNSGGTGKPFTPASNSRDATERFLREAKVTGKLEHPNIVPVYEIGRGDDGRLFYTMKFVRGHSFAVALRKVAGDRTTSAEEKLAARLKLLEAFQGVCDAMAYAHSRGVIHRDLKPANIMLGDFGETLVLDWGLARVKGEAPEAARSGDTTLPSVVGDDSGTITMDGSVMGTPAYMPPEQARGRTGEVDERSDVYALGAILYEILTGRVPYEAGSGAEILELLLNEPPPPVLEACKQAPPELAALCEKAMARDKADRLQSASELAREIRAFRDGRTLGVYNYTALEMLRRFVSRHRAAVATVCVALLVLCGVLAASFVRIGMARDRALDAEAVATQQKAQAEQNEAEAKRLSIEARQSRDKAEEEAARARISERKSRLAYAESLLREGERLESLGDWDAAREVYKGSAAIFSELGETPVLANLWQAYADTYGPRTLAMLGNDDAAWGSYATSTISSDGRYIVRAAYRQVSVFDVDQGEVSMTRRVGVFTPSAVAIIEPAGVVAAITGESVRTLGIADGARLYQDDAARLRPHRCAVTPDGGLVFVREGLRFAMYETGKYSQLAYCDLSPPSGGPPAARYDLDQVAISPDGRMGLAMPNPRYNGAALVFKLDEPTLPHTPLRPEGQSVHAACFTSSDRALLALADGRVLDWSFTDNRAVKAVRASSNPLVLLATDGERIACIDNSGIAYWGGLSQVFETGGFSWLEVEPAGQALALRKGQDKLVLSTPLRPWLVYDLKDGARQPTRADHAARCNGIPVSNGAQVLSAGLDGQLILWDVRTQQALRKTVVNPRGGLRLLAVDSLESYALLAAGDDMFTMTELLCVDINTSHKRWSRATRLLFGSTAAISPLGDLIVAPGAEGRPRLLHAHDGSEFKVLNWRESSDSIRIRVSPRGQHCVVAGSNWIRRYQMSDGALMSECKIALPADALHECLDISPDLETVLVAHGAVRHQLLRVSATTGAVLTSRTIRLLEADGVRYRDDNSILAIDMSLKLALLDARTLEQSSALDISTRLEAMAVSGNPAFSSDGRVCVISSVHGFLYVADLGGPLDCRRDALSARTTEVQANAPGTHAVAYYQSSQSAEGEFSGELALWDTVDGALVQLWQRQLRYGYRCAVSHDGRRVVSCDDSGLLQAWEVGNDTAVGELSPQDYRGIILCDFAPGGELFTVCNLGVVRRHAWPSLRVEKQWLAGTQRNASAASINHEAGIALTHDYFGPVVGVELSSDSVIFRRPRHRDAYQAFAVSPDGKRVALLAAEDTFEMWDLRESRSIYRRARSTSSLEYQSQLCWLAGGRLLMAPVTDGNAIDLWDTERGALLRRFILPTGSPTGLRVADDGTWLVCGRESASVTVWRTRPALSEKSTGADYAAHGLYGLAVRADPNSPAEWHALSGDVERARAMWTATLGPAAAHSLAGLHYFRLADRALARTDYWRAFLHTQRGRLDDSTLLNEAHLARCVGSKGSRGFMTHALTQASRNPGANPELLLLLGRLLLDEDRAGQCERVLKPWCETEGYVYRAGVQRLRGQALIALGRGLEAAGQLRQACTETGNEYWRMDYLRALCLLLNEAPNPQVRVAALSEFEALSAYTPSFDARFNEPEFQPLRGLPGFEAAKARALDARAKANMQKLPPVTAFE